MRMSLFSLLRPAIFSLSPETAHRAAVRALACGLVVPHTAQQPMLQTSVLGLSFDNPIGLAPGFDKNAECFKGAFRAGFGFVEIGTVTPRPQPGNPLPRVFRLVDQEAIINRLGFNNQGVEAVLARLRRRSGRGIIGGNIGKNKESSDALADYCEAMRGMYPYVDYITANISSPNTPGLRALQSAQELVRLIEGLQQLRHELVAAGAPHRPIMVKIAPDGDDALFEAIADVARSTRLDALIVSNTTIDRRAVQESPYAQEAGGLSGRPLFAASTARLAQIYRLTEGEIPLIGVGGIASAADAYAKIRAGASLIQLYSALVFQGFGLIASIREGLVSLLTRDGYATVAQAVGQDA
jgi:dihydroorotate dehydrogenase